MLPCTIKFNNYLLIMAKKTDIEKIDNYEQLIEKLKLWEVSPQETWDLVQKIKFNTSKKTIWKMRKFHMYIEYRGMSLIDDKVLDKVEILANKSKLMGRAHMIEYFKNVKKYLPNRVDSIKKLVNSDLYKSSFKFFNKNKKIDIRLEIKNLEKLIAEQKSIAKNINTKEVEIEACEENVLESIKMVGTFEQKVENLREQKQEYQDLQREFAAYDLYMRCMHPNGIAYDVIKKKIPVINEEIAKVLANIVDFEVFFEATGNKFDIFIKHPKYEERPIEMASGAEKSLSAMAIRLALLGVSSLPTGDIFILDEPGTALDEDNMSGFIRILELIKVYFKNVLLISHLDSLKDCVDMQIVIDKKKGYARVNQ